MNEQPEAAAKAAEPKRYDPFQRFDQGGTALGEMRPSDDGDWIAMDDYIAIRDEWAKTVAAHAATIEGLKLRITQLEQQT